MGAGLGALFANWWVHSGDVMYIALIVATLVAVFLCGLGAMIKFTKFTLENES